MTGWPCDLCVSGECSDPKCRGGWYCQAAFIMPQMREVMPDIDDQSRACATPLTVETVEELLAEVPDEAWDAAPVTGPDTRQPDNNGWYSISQKMPEPHARYRVYRKGRSDGFFDATPCYGLHQPWWVPRNGYTLQESEPIAMEPTDRWQPLPPPPED